MERGKGGWEEAREERGRIRGKGRGQGEGKGKGETSLWRYLERGREGRRGREERERRDIERRAGDRDKI